jgi:hypothetical protein
MAGITTSTEPLIARLLWDKTDESQTANRAA